MNIKVLGWYGNTNAGDESYKLAFPVLFPSHKFDFISSAKDVDFSNTDLIILGGGDVVYTSYTTPLYNIDVPKMALSVTITPGSDLEHLSMFNKVIVRDQLSLDLAGKYNSNVSYLPDFSFALTPNRARGRELLNERAARLGVRLTPKILTVVINSYISYNHRDALARDVNDFNNLLEGLSDIVENLDSSAVFLPFCTKMPFDDIAPSAWLQSRCRRKPGKNLLIRDEIIPVQDTLDMISASDAVVSSRLHSSIFATISGTPFVDVLHHDKNAGFLKTLGREDWGNWLWWFDAQKADRQIREFLAVGGAGAELQAFTRKAKEQLASASKYTLR
jgi:polysaccharide pyruvyl transferase WcaK-like protein